MPTFPPRDRRSPVHHMLANATLAVGAVIVCLSLLEGGLRLFWRHAAQYAAATEESLFWRHDSLLGWAMAPNARGQFVRPEFAADIQTNSLGLRDDELSQHKVKNEFRILLLGDSVTAGFEVARSETHEAQLESRLNALGDGWQHQVINAGLRGYGTDQELLFLQTRGLALAPDLIVLAFVPANDLEDNVTVHAADRVYAKPYFEYAADGSLVLRGVPVPTYATDQHIYSNVMGNTAPEQPASHGGPLKFFKRIMSQNLYLYGFVAERLKSGHPRLVAMLKRLGFLHHTMPPAFLDFYRSPLPQSWQGRWQLTFDLLLEIKRVCHAHNIPLLLWTFPLKEQIYQREQRILLEEYGVTSADYDFVQPEQIMADFCRKHNILLLSPLARFRHEALEGRRLHFISDNHFNAAGHAVLADELFGFLRDQRLLPEKHQKEIPPQSTGSPSVVSQN